MIIIANLTENYRDYYFQVCMLAQGGWGRGSAAAAAAAMEGAIQLSVLLLPNTTVRCPMTSSNYHRYARTMTTNAIYCR